MILEFQRYGRNKETTVDSSYISGGEYRRKFDSIIDNAAVSRILYSKAKEMLLHRSGTLFEDMLLVRWCKRCCPCQRLRRDSRRTNRLHNGCCPRH